MKIFGSDPRLCTPGVFTLMLVYNQSVEVNQNYHLCVPRSLFSVASDLGKQIYL